MHRVKADVAITVQELNFDHGQIVDMLQVLADLCFGVLGWVEVVQNQVACGTAGDLVCHMTRQNKLSICPADVDLFLSILLPRFLRTIVAIMRHTLLFRTYKSHLLTLFQNPLASSSLKNETVAARCSLRKNTSNSMPPRTAAVISA